MPSNLDADRSKILEYIIDNFKDLTCFVLDPVSVAKAKGIKIKPNRHEAEVLAWFKINNYKGLEKTG